MHSRVEIRLSGYGAGPGALYCKLSQLCQCWESPYHLWECSEPALISGVSSQCLHFQCWLGLGDGEHLRSFWSSPTTSVFPPPPPMVFLCTRYLVSSVYLCFSYIPNFFPQIKTPVSSSCLASGLQKKLQDSLAVWYMWLAAAWCVTSLPKFSLPNPD